MMSPKRVFVLTLAAAVSGLLLASCASTSPTPATERPPSFYPPSYATHYGKGNPLFDIAHVDVSPVPVEQALPEKFSQTGRVLLEYVISKTGNIEFSRVVSATSDELSQATIAATKRWVFQPAQKNGVSVNCRVRQEFSFH